MYWYQHFSLAINQNDNHAHKHTQQKYAVLFIKTLQFTTIHDVFRLYGTLQVNAVNGNVKVKLQARP